MKDTGSLQEAWALVGRWVWLGVNKAPRAGQYDTDKAGQSIILLSSRPAGDGFESALRREPQSNLPPPVTLRCFHHTDADGHTHAHTHTYTHTRTHTHTHVHKGHSWV